ncbi:hypothetical protein BOX15_Mlig000887g4 [Macrostomum lignano]|uniref:Uncharacterized protein n=3 Tax=Macrostomum lignano TaxID=282301 RepID=A0A267EN22_9PLAT|nr:hypothetical protein BOX15_Mlig000887g4 [Macrostomum lignano]
MSADPLDSGAGGGSGALRMNLNRRQRMEIDRDWRDVNWRGRSAIMADRVGRARRADLMADIERKLAPGYAPPKKPRQLPQQQPQKPGNLQVLLAGKPAVSPRNLAPHQPSATGAAPSAAASIAALAEANRISQDPVDSEAASDDAGENRDADIGSPPPLQQPRTASPPPRPPAIIASQGAVRQAPVAIKAERPPLPPPTAQKQINKKKKKKSLVSKSLSAVDPGAADAAEMEAAEGKSEQALLEEARTLAQLTRRDPAPPLQSPEEATAAPSEPAADSQQRPAQQSLAPRSINQILSSMQETGGRLPPTAADRQIEQLMRRFAERRGEEFHGFEDDQEAEEAAAAEAVAEAAVIAEAEAAATAKRESEEAAAAAEKAGPKSVQAELQLAELMEESRQADELTDLKLESLEDRLTTARSALRSGRSASTSARTPFMTNREVLELSRLPAEVSITDVVSVQGRHATMSQKKPTQPGRPEEAADNTGPAVYIEPMMPTSKPDIHSLCLKDDTDWRRTEPAERRDRKERHLLTRLPAAPLQAEPTMPTKSLSDAETAGVDRIMKEIESYEAWQKRAMEALRQLQADEAEEAAAAAAGVDLNSRRTPQLELVGSRVQFLGQTARRVDMLEPPPPRAQAGPEQVRAALFKQYESALPSDEFGAVGRGFSPVSANAERRQRNGTDFTGTGAAAAGAATVGSANGDVVEGIAMTDVVEVEEGALTRMRLQNRLSRSIERLNAEYRNEGGVESFFGLRRSSSLPTVHLDEEDNLVLNLDYNSIEKELQAQTRLMVEEENRVKLNEASQSAEEQQQQQQSEQGEGVQEGERAGSTAGGEETSAKTDAPRSKVLQQLAIKEPEPTPAQLALAAGRKYVILPRQVQQAQQQQQLMRQRRGLVSMARIDAIERFLNEPANQLARRESLDSVKKPADWELRVPKRIRSTRRRSLPLNLRDDFPAWAAEHGYRGDGDPRDWVPAVWDLWFDEVYPPSSRDGDREVGADAAGGQSQRQPQRQWTDSATSDSAVTDERALLNDPEFARVRHDSDSSSEAPSEHPVQLPEKIPPALDEIPEADRETAAAILEQEVAKLTADIEAAERLEKLPSAFQLCRRGALRRKLGYLRGAREDLDRCIGQEPRYLDAYWHRHLLKVLENRLSGALDDLNVLLKHTKDNASAYKARAEIYRKKNDVTMAIINYGQAIKLNPSDADCYHKRAGLYEKRGEMRLALEDYSMASKLSPDKTDALFKHGLYYFQNEQWQFAINDFTELLTRDPKDSRAYTYIGRCYAKLQQMIPAVQAFSSAIHLNPYNWIAFYHRGRLLRRAQPDKALRDLSISVMLNEDVENAMAFMYRGILYCEMDRPEDAIPDFETLVRLRQDIPCAHVNLGLVYHHTDRHHLAIHHYSAAINVDPTYIRAVRCRVDAFVAMREYRNALLDITRCIHMNPMDPSYYMVRGEILLKMGNLDMAAFCVRHSAAMNHGRRSAEGASPTQRALVLSFLGQFDEAIRVLAEEARFRPGKDILFLLGKTQMKAKRFADAAGSFQECLEILKPWGGDKKLVWPKEAAQVHYLIGDCHTALQNYGEGLESYTAALAIDSGFADGFYHRGLCRILMKQAKGVQDLNQALAINPAMYQVYLSRAAHYACEGRYSKAVLNCNEALRLQPQCVRALLYRGSIKCRIRAYGLAVDDLTRAIAVDPTCALAYFNRAVCHGESRQPDLALRDYGVVLMLNDRRLRYRTLVNRGLLYLTSCSDPENALGDFLLAARDRPNDERLLHAIGTCYHRLRRLPQAVRAFSRALDANSNFYDAYIGRANCYLDFGSPRSVLFARRDYERVLMSDPRHLAARVNLAFSLQMDGRMRAAWDQLSAAIRFQPDSPKPWECRAVVSLQMSNLDGALADANEAVRLRPSSAESLVTRGVVQQCAGDRVSAMRDYQKAILAEPSFSLAYYNAANVYLQQRQYHQALRYYDSCIRLNPADEGAHNNRALTRGLLGDVDGALADASRAIELSPHMAHAFFNRGKLAVRAGNFDSAEADFSAALLIQPDDPVVLKSRADCLGKLGKRQAAIEDYKRAVQLTDR